MENKKIRLPLFRIVICVIGMVISILEKDKEISLFIILLLCNVCILFSNLKKKEKK